MMTVRDLIAELQKVPPETRVVAGGYEGGYVDLFAPEMIRIALNVNDPEGWIFGPHDDAAPGNDDHEQIDALLIAKSNPS